VSPKRDVVYGTNDVICAPFVTAL